MKIRTLVHKLDWGPGYRNFKCASCGHYWGEKSRHCESRSLSCCPKCRNEEYPESFDAHYEWETDKSGNLIDGDE